MHAIWIILAGSLVALMGAILGSFLLLRRMSLLTDAIAHATLPGIVVGFFLAGERSSPALFAGAVGMGLFAVWAIQWVRQRAGIYADAATGVVFTSLFALGVIWISMDFSHVDLDAECVLFGELAFVPLDRWEVGGYDLGPRQIWVLGSTLLVVVGVLAALYRPLVVSSFDPVYATVSGLAVGALHYVLLGLVSLSSVAAFESVGVVLVLALFSLPPASAYLLTRSLPKMLALASLFGVGSAVGGYLLAYALDASVAGAMATVGGLGFVLALSLRKWAMQRVPKGYFQPSLQLGAPAAAQATQTSAPLGQRAQQVG